MELLKRDKGPFRSHDVPEQFFRWQTSPVDYAGQAQKVKISLFRDAIGAGTQQYLMARTSIIFTRRMGAFSSGGPDAYYQLDEKANEELDHLLSSLPPSTIGPPLDKLICISHEGKEAKWVTHTYSTAEMPFEVRILLETIGYYQVTTFGKKQAGPTPDPAPRIRRLTKPEIQAMNDL